MKQLRLKLKYEEIHTLDEWIESLLQHEDDATTFAELCALAVLSDWQKKKLKPKLYYITTRHIAYSLQAPQILALLHFIGKSKEPVTSFTGYCLHNLKTIIYQVYNNTKLVG